ncbi:MAG: HepT-like ribonuclease domain-containing protein [Thermomicrobiales bacterium]
MYVNRETAMHLHAARNACLEIEGFVAGATRESIRADRFLQLALQKSMEIVGAALDAASAHDLGISDAIPDLRQYIDLRDHLFHDYDSIDYPALLVIATGRVPVLRQTLDELLQGAPVSESGVPENPG